MALPHEVVDRQRAAYNRQDLDEFMECHHPEVTLIHHDGTVLADGHHELRSLYDEFFVDQPDAQAEIFNRIALGSVVIDEEHITGVMLEGEPSEMYAAVLYRVEDDLIVHVQIFL